MTPQKRSSKGKWIFLVVILAAGYGTWRWFKTPSTSETPEFKTEKIARGDLTQIVTANGQINAVKSVTVGSQVSGIITEIKADFNSRVTNGQVIAQIDPSTYQQNIMQAEAELANAQAALDLAELNMRRSQALRTNELVSLSEFDQAGVTLQQAKSVVKMRDAALKRAQVDLERTTIYAPIDGIVISRVVDEGQTVAASFNAPTLFTIANDLRNMRIEAMVSEADVGGVQEDQQVNFNVDAFPGRQFRGQVTQVRFAPITNQNVVNYTAVVEVNNDDLKLRPGMTANASIVIAQRRDVLRVANSALRFRPPERSVIKPPGATNRTSLASAASDGPPGGRRGDGPGGGDSGGERPSREEMRRRFESMTPEQREQMRNRSGSRGGGGGGGGGPEGQSVRTVYLMEPNANASAGTPAFRAAALFSGGGEKDGVKPVLKPVTVKTGISDGTYTEILEGLKEGDIIVTGLSLPAGASAGMAGPRGGTPFGGPFGGGGRPR